jgi:hypothetical protein
MLIRVEPLRLDYGMAHSGKKVIEYRTERHQLSTRPRHCRSRSQWPLRGGGKPTIASSRHDGWPAPIPPVRVTMIRRLESTLSGS